MAVLKVEKMVALRVVLLITIEMEVKKAILINIILIFTIVTEIKKYGHDNHRDTRNDTEI
jgi:hypothetical protein